MNAGIKACSSVAERCYYMAGVGGSIPSAPIAAALNGGSRDIGER